MEELKSPFWENTNEKFVDEMIALSKKYGFSQIFVAYAETFNKDEDDWHGYSNVMSEGMADSLEEEVLPYIRETLEESE